jgi:hypothetical protein
VEKRLAKLENLVAQLLPGIDIDEVLASPDLAKPSLPSGVPTSFEPASTTPRPVDDALAESSGSVLPEAVPNNADGFNWQEENLSAYGLTDGMAALSVEPTGVGYLGTSACSSVCRSELTITRLHVWCRVPTMFARLGWLFTPAHSSKRCTVQGHVKPVQDRLSVGSNIACRADQPAVFDPRRCVFL